MPIKPDYHVIGISQSSKLFLKPRLVVRVGVLALAITALLGAWTKLSHADNSGSQYISVDAVDSEYWNEYIQGASGVLDSLGKKGHVVASNYSGPALIAQYQAIFSAGCNKCAIAGDASSGAFVKAWVERAAKAGAFVVTVWTRPNGVYPWDVAPTAWVAHTSFDGVGAGYMQTKALCEAMGGHGGIAALKGFPDAPPAPQRIKGLKDALAKEPACKNVKLLAVELGDWDQTKAQSVVRTWIARFGSQLNGIMGSNDAMARGAIAALREKGLNRKVFVTGADGASDSLNEIKTGDLLMTVWNDPVLQGAVAMSIAYAASVGDLDPSKLTHRQRDFYMKQAVVNASNVDDYIAQKKQHAQYTYAQMKGHWFDYIESQIPENANDLNQDK